MCTSRTRVLSAVECRRLRRAHGAEADSKHEPGGESNYAHVSCPRLGTTSVEKAWPGDVVRTRLPCAHGDRGGGADGVSLGQKVRWSARTLRVGVETRGRTSGAGRDGDRLVTNEPRRQWVVHKYPQLSTGWLPNVPNSPPPVRKVFHRWGRVRSDVGRPVDSPHDRTTSINVLSGADWPTTSPSLRDQWLRNDPR
jgi:hypothetical protein